MRLKAASKWLVTLIFKGLFIGEVQNNTFFLFNFQLQRVKVSLPLQCDQKIFFFPKSSLWQEGVFSWSVVSKCRWLSSHRSSGVDVMWSCCHGDSTPRLCYVKSVCFKGIKSHHMTLIRPWRLQYYLLIFHRASRCSVVTEWQWLLSP